MRDRRTKNKERRTPGKAILLCILILVLAALLCLRFLNDGRQKAEAALPEPTAEAPEQSLLSPEPKENESLNGTAEDHYSPQETELPVLEEHNSVNEGKRYSEYTYGLATDMVFTWRHRQTEGAEEIAGLLEKLKQEDPALGKVWEAIMNTWIYVDTELECHYDSLPDGLAEDDSLCIVVLGYQLKADGSMAPELTGRCETALRCAEKYPYAFVAVTGGGTASKDRSATEADAMADWLISHGISRDRIIIENTSMTTVQNAKKTCSILAEHYPQIEQVAIVSSNYHIPLGTLLFQEAAVLYEYENGRLPYTVVSNAALAIVNTEEHLDIAREAQDLWSLADPQY